MVQADRQRTKFMKRFIKDQKATSNKKKEKTELVAVTAVHLLWDDDAQTPSERTIAKTLSEEESSQDSDATDTAEIAPVKV